MTSREFALAVPLRAVGGYIVQGARRTAVLDSQFPELSDAEIAQLETQVQQAMSAETAGHPETRGHVEEQNRHAWRYVNSRAGASLRPVSPLETAIRSTGVRELTVEKRISMCFGLSRVDSRRQAF